MTYYLNYIIHRTSDPAYSYVPHEQKTTKIPTNPAAASAIQRLAHISIPFLTLYKPLGSKMGLAMGGYRTISYLVQAIEAGKRKELYGCTSKLLFTALSVASVASSVFHHRIGLIATTGIDILQNLESMRQHYITGKTDLLIEDAVQLTTSSLYLAVMITNSLEISLLSICVQIVHQAYQARHEWNDGNNLEALAKLMMCLIRAYEGHHQWGLIQQRNRLLADPLMQQLALIVKQGKKVESLLSSPLSDMKEKLLEKAVVLEDAEGKKYEFGSHFHGFGKGLVKGANLCVRERLIDGKAVLEIDFKINHAFRDQLEGAITNLSTIASNEQVKEVLALTHSNIEGIEITRGMTEIGGFNESAHQLNFAGIGSIVIGDQPSTVGLYSRVIVRIFQECNLFQLHEMLSFVQLEDALQVFNADDLERLKLGLLFRTCFPKEATAFERSMQFFKLPISQLKAEMNKRAPIFSEVFNRYYSRIIPYEILPGRIRYGINGLGKICEKLGAKALMSSIWIRPSGETEGLNRIASILKMGMLSTEMRFGNQFNIDGLSSDTDLETGGSDSIFTQLVPSNYFTTAPIAQDFMYFQGVALTFNLDILGTGTYQYHYDSFGSRRVLPGIPALYGNRPNIFDFIAQERKHLHTSNEVMVKDRIPPSFITSILVSDQGLMDKLTDHLRTLGLIQSNSDGVECINNIPLNQFIRTPSKDEPISHFFVDHFVQKVVKKLAGKIYKHLIPF